MSWAGLLLLGGHLLLIALALPLARGKTRPGTYGLRTELTLSAPRIWDAANRTAGWAMVACALLGGSATAICSWGPRVSLTVQVAVGAGTLLLAAMLPNIPGLVMARRVARTLE